jgi:cytochrome c
MDSFELNKIAGAVLGTALAVFGIGQLSGMIFHSEVPSLEEGAHVKPGYKIEAASSGGEAAGGEATAEVESIGARLAKADVAKGTAAAKACAACHDFTKGGPNKVGPNLYDIVERAIGSHEGFTYNDALKGKASEKWTYDNLDAFIQAPKKFAPGTKMSYGGMANAQDRASLIAYLASLSDAPKPFPAP